MDRASLEYESAHVIPLILANELDHGNAVALKNAGRSCLKAVEDDSADSSLRNHPD